MGTGWWPTGRALYIVTTPELDFVFYTLQTNRKCLNLRRDPRIAVVIGWEGEQTVQYEGIAEESNEYARADARQAFLKAQPERAQMVDWPGATFFRVKPIWIRFSDYGKPWRVDEMTFPENKPKERRSRLGLFRKSSDKS